MYIYYSIQSKNINFCYVFFYVRVDFKERLENFVRVLSYFVFSWLLITPLLYIVVLQIINEGIDVY